MRLPGLASIRTQLVILVLLAVLPALGIVLLTGIGLRDAALRAAEDAALRQVQSMAVHHERVVDNARLLLATLAKAREVRQLDAQACQNLLTDILAKNEAYSALALVDPEGRLVAASPPNASPHSVDLPAFRSALHVNRFSMGEYHLASDIRRVVIEFIQPVAAEDGSSQGLLVASFDLNYFGRIFAAAHLPEGSIFTLTDASGMRLTRFPETAAYTWVPDLPRMIERMSGSSEEGTFLEQGVDGVRRLYSFKRLRIADAPFPHLLIRLGQPENLALAEARRVMARNAMLVGVAAALAVVAAWIVGEFTIMRRLNRLMTAADNLGGGDLSARTGLPRSADELGRLAAAFDRMAQSLEIHDADRRRAEEECCMLNTDLELRVGLRTAELAKANADLQTALENLRQAQSQLVMSEKLAALGELVAGVAHEINTPVGVALSATSTMAERTRALRALFAQGEMKRSDLTAYVESMGEGAEMSLVNLHRASDLIRGFKMVAADQVSETRRVFKVREYIGEILLSLRPKLKKTAHTVEVVCDADLAIESYPGALSQILTNFIINSLTHAFDEGQSGQIRIEVVQVEDVLTLTYSDNGRGIPPEVQARVFEPFYTTARAKGSTGLGLHIVFNVVTHTLGGTITCCSAPGHGTSFQVRVPMEKAHGRQ